ncbi:MAG: hypothetical protein KME11_19185 [Timaviella obliquedivisa GSE-PSE-MK23-08B]|nr:hypothetical protein [Timaviella obliquedivisa GSE-PSE-MK23-08B]
MSPQVKSRLTAIALIIASVCGTSAIFGCVPLLANLTSSQPNSAARPVAHPTPLSEASSSQVPHAL